ncbi:DNA-binding transcriptional regulator, FadR family [Pseudomonas lutea]|uniref:DNA-binding transcriptional regulator, FadR family n=2 Tax=Pseudomonas TaxID=286 RepID=A0A9X8QL46_9PSED|nr:DNA-binding transcriptional regulator, FadR family [Pseudomonas lutea]
MCMLAAEVIEPRKINEPLMIDRPSQKPKRLAEELVARLSQYIRDGIFKRGEKLPSELEISSSEGFSRSVVREALLRLQAAGLVETRRSVGTFIVDMPPPPTLQLGPETISTLQDVLSLLELRMSLEVEAAGLAAQNRSPQELKEIELALLSMKDSGPKTGIAIHADSQFHLRIAKASGNAYMFDIMKHLGTKLIPRTKMNSAYAAQKDRVAYLDLVYREHEKIYSAIALQSPDSARAAMYLHLSNSRVRLYQAHEARHTLYE